MAIMLGWANLVQGGSIYHPEDSMEFWEEMEMSDKGMLQHLSCPHKEPNGIWCKIWRNNHLSTLLD